MKEKKIEQIEEIIQRNLDKQLNPYELKNLIYQCLKDYLNSHEFDEKFYELFCSAVGRYEKEFMLNYSFHTS